MGEETAFFAKRTSGGLSLCKLFGVKLCTLFDAAATPELRCGNLSPCMEVSQRSKARNRQGGWFIAKTVIFATKRGVLSGWPTIRPEHR
jgi:hypothetical protein